MFNSSYFKHYQFIRVSSINFLFVSFTYFHLFLFLFIIFYTYCWRFCFIVIALFGFRFVYVYYFLFSLLLLHYYYFFFLFTFFKYFVSVYSLFCFCWYYFRFLSFPFWSLSHYLLWLFSLFIHCHCLSCSGYSLLALFSVILMLCNRIYGRRSWQNYVAVKVKKLSAGSFYQN